jgi:hypothetical protein
VQIFVKGVESINMQTVVSKPEIKLDKKLEDALQYEMLRLLEKEETAIVGEGFIQEHFGDVVTFVNRFCKNNKLRFSTERGYVKFIHSLGV